MNLWKSAVFITLACVCSCTPTPHQQTPLQLPTPAPPVIEQPTIPPLEALERDVLEEYRRKVSEALANQTDDKRLADRLHAFNTLIDELLAEAESLKARESELGDLERNRYAAVRELIDRTVKKREDEIDTAYRGHTVQFKDLDNFIIPAEALQELEAMRSEIRGVCRSQRTIVIVGFGCSMGKVAITQYVSELRADSVATWLQEKAGCKEGQIRDQGLGVEISKQNLATVDPAEVEPLLERSRHALLLLPR
jgi:outer membrane protein OmpA-like peptidoglycan-associated protein